MRLHQQRALQTHRHAMLALDVSQINWRPVAHLPTEDSWPTVLAHSPVESHLMFDGSVPPHAFQMA